MKQSIIYTITLFIACSIVILSCKKTPNVAAATCSGLDTKWSTAVNALVQTKCATSGCHDGGVKGGTYKTLAGIKGNSADALSEIYNKSMPKGSVSISDAERNQIMCWLQDGAPDN
jgi:uncharacterized membrane protein